MSLNLQPAIPRPIKNLTGRLLTAKGILELLHLTFISGPFLLFTTRLTLKHATFMMVLCAPALMLAVLLTVPQFLFSSPEQYAYYEFARVLNQDPFSTIILVLATLCTFVALAIPATAPKPFTAVRF